MSDEQTGTTATATRRRPARKPKTSADPTAIQHEQVAIADVVLDSDVQPRENISTATIKEYAEAMKGGDTFPEIIVYRDPTTNILIAADGWHRVLAAKEAEKPELAAEIRPGTKRDAILYSVSANATHGLRRTNDDKRRAVYRLLDDEEWGSWSDNVIAGQVGVSQPFVSGLRRSQNNGSSDGADGEAPTPRVRRTGDGREMNTGNIGRRPRTPDAPATNGHAPVEPTAEDGAETPDAESLLGAPVDTVPSGPMTVQQFASGFATMMLQIAAQEFDPEAVFEAMDKDTLDEVADKWDDVIGRFDKYSDALEKVLADAPS